MRNLYLLGSFRDVRAEHAARTRGNEGNGFFIVPSPVDKALMCVIASDGGGWDHVSVSRSNRCPNWGEMSHIKHLFFMDDEFAIEYHPPKADHINIHPYCLHLWRPQNGGFPFPPNWMVG